MKKIDRAQIHKKFNGVALIGSKNKIEEIMTQGYASFEEGRMHTEESNFWICSISKMFTAVAINQLCEKGLLDKTDLLETYMPEYFAGQAITIYHLLTHTSGIPNFIMYRKQLDWKSAHTAEEVLSVVSKKGLKFKPGTKWAYCNTGYYLLALIVEQVTKMKYEDYVKQYIFDVVGMKHSSFVVEQDLEVVKAYIKENHAYEFHPSMLYGAGDIVSNVKDLYQFGKGIIEGKLVSKKTLEEMCQPVFPDKKMQYGEGLFVHQHFDTPMFGHSGSIPTGYTTQLSIYPEKEMISVVLINNRTTLHPLVYGDANGKYVDACLAEQIFDKKIGVIKKAYL